MSLYTDKVIAHFSAPRNAGEMADADGVGTVGNPTCGDVMTLYLKIRDDVITDATFKTYGCAAAIATSSVLTEMIRGKQIRDAEQISNRSVVEELGGLPPQKIHCSVLAKEALEAALENYRARRSET